MSGGILWKVFAPNDSRGGVERTSKSRIRFHVSIVLIIGLCSMSTHALYETSAGSPLLANKPISQEDQVVWEYHMSMYSASGKSLSAEELGRMVKSMQKCGGSSDVAQQHDGKVTDASFTSFSPSAKKHDTGSQSVKVSSCKSILDSLLSGEGGGERAVPYYNQSSFEQICPRLLYLVGNANCCEENDNSQDSRLFLKKEKPTSGEVWGYGFLLVTIISCSSLVGVSLMPFMAKDFYKHLLTVMIGLAVGSLTGSAVFHLIPQALRLSDNDPDHGYLHISLVVVGGIWMFFMIERILKFIMDYKERKGKNWKREKMSSVLASSPESSTIAVMTENGNLIKGSLNGEANGEQRNSLIFPTALPRDTGVIYECQEQAIKASFGHQEKPVTCHDHHVTFEQGKDSVIATVAWMIIFGDGLHNFIDGLSIGAAFNESIWTGVSISVAVLCEELPHELGDFAVLLNAGMSMRQAVTYNFLSACTCYIGMAVGILLGEIQASSYIFALAGGMFLYISLVDMVPEMNEIAQETSKVSVRKGLLTLLLQNLGLSAGITALYLLALYQDSFQF